MKRKIVIMIACIMFLFSGCSLFHPNANVNINDGVLRLDNGTSIYDPYNKVPTVTELQAAIHEGKAFITGINYTIDSGNTAYALFKTDGKEIHFHSRRINVIDLSNQVIDLSFRIYENVTVTNNGTLIDVFNLERDSNKLNTLIAYANPTGINYTGSTYLFPFGNRILSDRKSSTLVESALKYTMKPDTYYIIEFYNDGIGDIEVEYDVIWIEEEK